MDNLKTLKRQLKELKRKARQLLGFRNTFGDRIVIEDEVLIYQGNKLLLKSKGHIVSQGLIGLSNTFGGGGGGFPNKDFPSYAWGAKTGGVTHVGTGLGVTTAAMTALVIDEGTDADSQSGALVEVAAGIYRISWIATWNAGTLAAIDVSELGLSLTLDPSLNAFEAGPTTVAKQFFSRISDADGDFTTFTVNIAVPLTVEWRLTFTFA